MNAGYGERTVVHELSLSVARGTVTALLGANGSGKSTLLRAVAGLCRIAGGRVRLGGGDAARLERRAIARLVAIVPQRVEVAAGYSVREVVAMGRAPHQQGWLRPSPADEEIIDETLADCELADFAARPIDGLSGGEQQRVHIARALAQRAPILLLDEAAAHLDLRHAALLHQLVRRLVSERELACLSAMHDLSAAARFADRAAILREGRLLAEGPAAEVMTAERLGEALGVEVSCSRTDRGTVVFSA